MPKVFTAKAAKDYPEHDIKKGDTYYHWSFFRGPKIMSKTRPRPSQLTGSSKLSTILAVQEELEDNLNNATCPDDVRDALQGAIDGAESSIDEYNDAISNLEDGFPNGCPQIDETEMARDSIEAWKDELESAQAEVEGLDANNYLDEDERRVEIVEKLENFLDRTPTEEEITKAFHEISVDSFDDLIGCEQDAMMDDARAHANGPSLSL